MRKILVHEVESNGGSRCRHTECAKRNATFPCGPFLAAEREKTREAEIREAIEWGAGPAAKPRQSSPAGAA